MPFDVAILVIILFFTIAGYKNGFVYSVFHVLGWLIAFVFAFIFRRQVRELIMDKTPVYDWWHDRVYDICSKFAGQYTDRLTGGLPDDGLLSIFGSAIDHVGEKIVESATNEITSTSFAIICFIGTVLVIKLILFIITVLFSRKYHDGVVGTLDAVGGIFVGIAQGFLFVFIMLIILPPVLFAVNPDFFMGAIGILNRSFLAETLFLNNPLAPLINSFVPDLFNPAEWLGKAMQIMP
jgi:uncharacterized membrane protein required for colicin V production